MIYYVIPKKEEKQKEKKISECGRLKRIRIITNV